MSYWILTCFFKWNIFTAVWLKDSNGMQRIQLGTTLISVHSETFTKSKWLLFQKVSFFFATHSESVWYLALLWSPFQAKPQSRGMNKRIDVVFLMLFTPPVHISSEYFGYHDIFPQLNLYLIFKVNTAYGNGRHWHSSGSHYNVLSGTFLTIHTDVFNRVNMRYNSVRFIFKSWNKQQSITWAWNPVKTTGHICWTNLV